MSTAVRAPAPDVGRATTRFAPRSSEWVAGHPVAAFFGLAYAFSWLFWLPAALGSRSAPALVALYIGVFGPAVAALLVTRMIGHSSVNLLRANARFRAAPRWYAAVIGFPLLFVAMMMGGFVLSGGNIDGSLLGERLAAYLPLLIVWSLAGVGEEVGWRGFALPRLQERWTPVRATLVLGLLWALWHLPILAASDEASHELNPLPLVGITLATLAAIVGYAFIYTYLWNKTRSIWLAVLLHGSFTAANGTFVLLPMDDQVGSTYVRLQLLTVAVLAIAAATLVRATRGHLGQSPERPGKE